MTTKNKPQTLQAFYLEMFSINAAKLFNILYVVNAAHYIKPIKDVH